MLCDDTVECLCSVFRNQENVTEVDNKQSARTTVFFLSICLHSFANFNTHLLTFQVMNNE